MGLLRENPRVRLTAAEPQVSGVHGCCRLYWSFVRKSYITEHFKMVIYPRGKTLQAGFDFSSKWLKGETIVVAVNSFICRSPQFFLAYIFFEKSLLNPMVEASAKPGTRFLESPETFRALFG